MANTLLDEWIFERTASKSFVMLAGLCVQKLCRIDVMEPNLTGNVLSREQSIAFSMVARF